MARRCVALLLFLILIPLPSSGEWPARSGGGRSGIRTTATVEGFEACIERAWGATETYRECRAPGGTKTIDWPDTTGEAGMELTLPAIGIGATFVMDFGGGTWQMIAPDADDVYGFEIDSTSTECGANGGGGQTIEIRNLTTTSTIGEKSKGWLHFTTTDDACNYKIIDSQLGVTNGLLAAPGEVFNEFANSTIEVSTGKASIALINTTVASAGLDTGEPLVDMNSPRTQSAFTMIGASKLTHSGTDNDERCVFVDSDGAAGDMQFRFIATGNPPQTGDGLPAISGCTGFEVDPSSTMKGINAFGFLEVGLATSSDFLFIAGDTDAAGTDSLIDLKVWLALDAAGILKVEDSGGDIDGLKLEVFGPGDLASLVAFGTGVTATMQNIYVNLQSGTASMGCADLFDAEADTAIEAANVLIGRVQSHDAVLGLDYVAGTDCTVLH